MLVHVNFEHMTQSITYTILAVNVHLSISIYNLFLSIRFIGRLWLSTASDVGCTHSTATISYLVANNLYLANPIDSSLLRELDKISLAAPPIFVFTADNQIVLVTQVGSSLQLML